MGITFKDLEHLIKKKKEIGPKIPVAPYIEFPNGNFNTPQTNTRYTEKYSGLNNQGSTCYLNSLIQTLFMTPEFRLNILNWKYQEKLHGQKADCIPYQIKKLFSKLQLKNRKSEETKSLTKSFQWGNSDAFYQHDIQELCRVLFEAIEMSLNFDEEKFKSEKNFINDIFEGFSSSVVKCKECEYESLRKDKFLDISLPIRNEFEKIYNNSLEIALNNYTRIETLENDNKYFCEKCNKKTDALKFIKFEEMPSVLLFQLNRFEYDYMTGNRIKIKDKVTFPLVLDMNLFMSQKFNTVLNEEYFKERSESKINLDEIEFDKEVKKSFENGDYVYELYSIVIHSGTANGGHYYAYIKSFEDGNWYCFNDSEVTIINENDLENVFGGKGNGYTSSGSGYVLLYGKIKKDQKDKIKFISNEEIDEEMMKDIEKDLTNEKKEDELFKDKLMKITIKIYYDSNSHNIEFRKNDTIIQMKEKIIKKFNLEGAVIPSDFKLRIYSEYVDKKMEYVEDEEKTIEENNISTYKLYCLQYRDQFDKFPEYNHNMFEGQLTLWKDEFNNLKKDNFSFVKFEFNKQWTQEEFMKNILNVLNLINEDFNDYLFFRKLEISPNNFNFIQTPHNDDDLKKEVLMCNIRDGVKIFVEKKEYIQENTEVNIKEQIRKPSKFLSLIENFIHEILICFNRPKPKQKNNLINENISDFSLRISTKDFISQLKSRMAEILNMDVNDFIMKKYGPNGTEIKNLNSIVSTLSHNDINLFLELGTPLKEDEILLNMNYCEVDNSEFKIYPYKFITMDKFIINNRDKIKDIKRKLVIHLKEKLNIEIENEEYLILRECKQDKPSKIYSDDTILSEIDFIENKNILLQEYKLSKLIFNEDDILVTIRYIDFLNWKINDPIEIFVNKNTTFLEFANMIVKYYPISIAENLSFLKVLSPNGILFDSLMSSNSFENVIENIDIKLSDYPFYIKNDGILFFIKDRLIDLSNIREPTEEETDFFYKRKKLKSYNNKVSSKNYENFQKGNLNSNSIVLKDDSSFSDSVLNANKRNRINEDASTLSKATGTHKFKEKNLVIKVKKNMAEDDLEKKEIEGTVISPDNQNNDEKIIKKESEKEKKTKRDIDNYADFDFEEENIIEPLI